MLSPWMKPLFDAGSSGPISSYEYILDSLRKVILGAGIPATVVETDNQPQTRDDLYQKVNALAADEKFTSLIGKLKIDVSPANLDDRARTDFSAFLSLFTLSPITLSGTNATNQALLITKLNAAWGPIYTQWQADISKADNDRTFSEAYLQDRAKMLNWVVQGNLQDAAISGTETIVQTIQPGVKENWLFTDASSGQKVTGVINNGLYQEQYDSDRAREYHSISFGSAGNDLNLIGDSQYGGDGDDALHGGPGSAYLEGGNGNDTYQLLSGGGVDTIVDCDGKGIIQIDGHVVTGTFSCTRDDQDFYYSADNNYRLSEGVNGQWELATKTGNTYAAVAQLNGWSSGDFGITMTTLPDGSRNTFGYPNTSLYLVIDAGASTTDTNLSGGKTIDTIKGSSYRDTISTGEGNSYVISWGGDDFIDCGSGNDFVIAGGNAYPGTITDNDIVKGGGGTDLISSGGGDDILWGDSDTSNYLNETTTSGTTGDWLNGGKGSDHLYGSSSQDILLAGSEDDVVQGGAGNDVIMGDASFLPYGSYGSITGSTVLSCVMNADQSWTSKTNDSFNSLTVVSGAAFKWQWSVTADKNITLTSQLTDFTTFLKNRVEDNAGNDVLDGGKGDDWIAGQAGNDTLFGGEGNDILHGDDAQPLTKGVEGNDVLYADAGADTLYGGGGNDLLSASDSDNAQDWLYGGEGNDTLFGGTGADQLQGDAGNDNLYAGSDGSTLLGGDGSDLLTGGAGNDTLKGNTGADNYISSGGTDTWTDDSGDDTYRLYSKHFTGTNKTTITDNDGKGRVLINDIQIDGNAVTATSKTTWRANDGSYTLTLSNTDLYIALNNQAGLGQVVISKFANTGNYLGITLPVYNAVPQPQVNHSPTVATMIADQNIKEETAFIFAVPPNAFVDTDTGDALTYSAKLTSGSALPSWLNFNAETRTFRGIPATGSAGKLDIQVSATDHSGVTVNDVFSLQIASAITVINGTTAADTLVGTATRDQINGLADNDVLSGYAGNDTLDGGLGVDTLVGGVGNDTYVIDNTGDIVTEYANEGSDLINSAVIYTLSANVENLTLTGATAINGTGNELSNILLGNSAANTLTGAAGNDTLNGGAGADKLLGGIGNDTYVIDNAGDVITENVNEGTDLVNSSLTYTLGTNLENLTLAGTTAINGTGNELSNSLLGNSAANTLTGAAGNDTLNGGVGADKLMGGIGNDTYVIDNAGDVITENANEGTDLVNSSLTYTLGTNLENLTLTGTTAINGTGNELSNILLGNSAINTLTGAAGNDTLNGGVGADKLMGGIGNDTYVIDNAGDVISENANEGTDLVNSSLTYTLGTNLENLTLAGTTAINGTGNSLNNSLLGNSAANALTGAAGNDTLNGGAGADTLVGGTGNDTYVLGRGYGNDGINENDTAAGNTDMAQFQSGIAVDQIWFQKVNSNLEVSIIGTNDKLTIQNWYTGNQYHVEQFKTADGKVLLDSQVNALVSAMAAFTPPAAGQMTLPSATSNQLQPVLAANWH